MDARFVEFNEALMALAQRLRDGAQSIPEFRLQRRQLLVALMKPQAVVPEAGPNPEIPPESPPKGPRIEKAGPRPGLLAAVFLLILLLAFALFATLA